MAEALVSVLLEQLASITLKQIEEEVRLVVGVDQEVQNLIGHLQAVQGVLQDAEERQVKEANVKNWLYNVKDVSYQINDVLDEWNTAILKHHMEKQEKEGENNDLVLAKRNKVRFSIPSFLRNIPICFGQIGIIMRHDIAKRIKEINERLTWIAILRNNYNFQSTVRGTEQVERSKTTSFVDVSTIIGREEEKKKILSMLESESGHQSVIAIVGMGGLGKTAFAQSVYNDQKLTTHFHKRIWVCVSDPFEEIKIAKAIIEVLNKDDTRKNSNEFQTLSECISENIDGIKFLLVLDDVWNPTDLQWEPLKEALQKGDANSRILATTRNNTVAIMMGATNDHMINLNKLSDQDCLELFRRIAFFDKEKDESKLFDKDIKNKIKKKVDGLPLAAKTLASLMRYKKTRNEWVAVLESKMWELEEVEQQVFQSLLLSYYDLTPAVRRCLLFCAVFPKDYEFDRNELIECWMSQEYLSMKGDREKERIGLQYFDNLVMRSFFQDFVKDSVNDDIKQCKMHDIVHDFVQFLTKNECFIMEVAESCNEKNMVVDNKVLHLNIMSTYNDSFPVSIYNCKGLRTLVISTSKLPPLPSDSFEKLKSIRTLKLNDNSIKEVPESIGGLVHLRYLDLSDNKELKELPDSVGNLFNLETLSLDGCGELRKLPVSIRKLVNLKHLYINGCPDLKVPKEIGRLRNLQILDSLYVQEGGEDDEGIFKLGDLGNLEQLQGSLYIANLKFAKDGSEAKNAELVNKKNLLHLALDFGYRNVRRAEADLKDEEILNGFQVHTNLESLVINQYHSTTLCPSWMMSCHNLRRLEFQVFPFCGVLAPLGKLPSLEYLEIMSMRNVKKVGVEFLGITGETPQTLIKSFPKLKTLCFKIMQKWEEWEGVEEEDSKITIMPSLLKLEIQRCDKLKALPNFLWKTPLRELSIEDCSTLAQGFETRCGTEWAKASQVQNIKINANSVRSIDREEAEVDLNQSLLAEPSQAKHLPSRVWIESKKLWRVVGPAIVSRLAGYSMGVITQAFAGHLGVVELASISIANNVVLGFTFGLLLGMASALETLCGQAFGAKRHHMLGIYLQRSWIVLFFCCILLLPIYIFASPILKLLGQADDVAEQTGVVSLWLLPLHFSYAFLFPLQRFLQSQLKNFVTLWVSLVVLVFHALISWLFVYVLDFGVVGAAVALDISWWVLCFGLLGYVTCGWCPLSWTGFSMEAFYGLWEFVKLSTASGVMLCLEFWYYRILILMTGYLQNATLAVDALSICMTINGWELMIHLAFFAGTGVRVANELGAGNGQAAKFAAKVSAAESTFIALFFGVLIIIFRDQFGYIFTSSTDVLQSVSEMSYLLAVTILLNGVQPVLSGVAVGSGWQTWVAYINLFCYYIIGLPLGFVMGWVANLGVMGIWGGMILGGTAVQTVLLAIVTTRRDWEKEAQEASQRVNKWSTPNPDDQTEEQQ